MSNTVVLPAPLGPIRAVMLPAGHLERASPDGLKTAERLVQVAGFEYWGHHLCEPSVLQ